MTNIQYDGREKERERDEVGEEAEGINEMWIDCTDNNEDGDDGDDRDDDDVNYTNIRLCHCRLSK